MLLNEIDKTLVEDESDTLVEAGRVESKVGVEGAKIYVENVTEEIVTEHKLIEKSKLSTLKERYESYIDSILDSNSINKTLFYSFLSKRLNLKFYKNYRTLESKITLIDEKIISKRLLKALNIILFKLQGSGFELVTSNPYNYEVIDFVQNRVGGRVIISIA